MVATPVSSPVELEIEKRFCLTKESWEQLSQKLNCSRCIFQKDVTWMVENSPSKMAIERYRIEVESNKSQSFFLRKEMIKKGGETVRSLESPRIVFNPQHEVTRLDTLYPRDLEISKFRLVTGIGVVYVCLDYLPNLGYFTELEVSSDDHVDELNKTIVELGLKGKDDCKGYGYYIANNVIPNPVL